MNDAPFAPDVNVTTDEDTGVPLNLGFFDVDGEPLIARLQQLCRVDRKSVV